MEVIFNPIPKLMAKQNGEYEFEALYKDTYVLFNDASKDHNLLYAIKKDNCLIQFQLEGINPESVETTDTGLVYPKVFPNVDLKYELQSDTVKETFVIHDSSAKHMFNFNVLSEGVNTHFNEDGSIDCICESDESELWTVAAPIAWDANNNPLDVNMSYTETSYSLEVVTDENTVYPVYLDPTLTFSNGSTYLTYTNGYGAYATGSSTYTLNFDDLGFTPSIISLNAQHSAYSTSTNYQHYTQITFKDASGANIGSSQTLTSNVVTNLTVPANARSIYIYTYRSNNTSNSSSSVSITACCKLYSMATEDDKFEEMFNPNYYVSNTTVDVSVTTTASYNVRKVGVIPSHTSGVEGVMSTPVVNSVKVNGVTVDKTNFNVNSGDSVVVNITKQAGVIYIGVITFSNGGIILIPDDVMFDTSRTVLNPDWEATADFVNGTATNVVNQNNGYQLGKTQSATTIMDDFEGDAKFTYTGDWIKSTTRVYAGSHSFTNKDIGGGGASFVQFPVTIAEGGGAVSYYRYLSSEANYDFFRCYVDGVEVYKLSGAYSTWFQVSHGLGAGEHTIQFHYSKDGGGDYGDDSIFIDNLQVTNMLAMVQVPTGNVISAPINVSTITGEDEVFFGYNADVPANTSVVIEYSVNGGTTWVAAPTSYTVKSDINTASSMLVRATLSSTNVSVTPTLYSVTLLHKQMGPMSIPVEVSYDIFRSSIKNMTSQNDVQRQVETSDDTLHDSLRKNVSGAIVGSDALRSTIINSATGSDSRRIITVPNALINDTKRTATSEANIDSDTVRNVVSVLTIDNDSRRMVTIPAQLELDIKRTVGSDAIIIADTERDVIVVFYQEVNLDTHRIAHKVMELPVDMQRLTMAANVFTYDLDRYTGLNASMIADTSRMVKYENCFFTETFNPADTRTSGVAYAGGGITLGMTTVGVSIPYSLPGWTLDGDGKKSRRFTVDNNSTAGSVTFTYSISGVVNNDTSTGFGDSLLIYIDGNVLLGTISVTSNKTATTVTYDLDNYSLSQPFVGSHEIWFRYSFAGSNTYPKTNITNFKMDNQAGQAQATTGEAVSKLIDVADLHYSSLKFVSDAVLPAGSSVKYYYYINGTGNPIEITNLNSYKVMNDLYTCFTVRLKAVLTGTETAIPIVRSLKLYEKMVITFPIVLNLDSKRRTKKAITSGSDSKRAIMSPIVFTIDSDRKTGISSVFTADTVRKAAKMTEMQFDSLRTVLASEVIDNDTKRSLLKLIGVSIDSERKIATPIVIVSDTDRTISAETMVLLSDTLRKIVKDTESSSDSNRRTFVSDSTLFDNERMTSVSEELLNDATRLIMASTASSSDTHRKAVKDTVNTSDLLRATGVSQTTVEDILRRVVKVTTVQNDSNRRVLNLTEANTDTIRNTIAEIQSIHDSKRRTLRPAESNSDTLRQVLALTSVTRSLDTLRYTYITPGREYYNTKDQVYMSVTTPNSYTDSATCWYTLDVSKYTGPGTRLSRIDTNVVVSKSANNYWPNTWKIKFHFYNGEGTEIGSGNPSAFGNGYIDIPEGTSQIKIEYMVGYIYDIKAGASLMAGIYITLTKFYMTGMGKPYYMFGDTNRIKVYGEELNTDTEREVSLETIVRLNADTSRITMNPYEFISDTRRPIGATAQGIFDTYRISTWMGPVLLNLDTLRELIKDESNAYDLLRLATSDQLFITDTLRTAIYKDDIILGDTIRPTGLTDDINLDTYRIATFTYRADVPVDTHRTIVTPDDIISDLLRLATENESAFCETSRITRATVKIDASTERELMKAYINGYDLKKVVIKDDTAEPDTKRIAIAIKPGIKLYNYSIETEYNVTFNVSVKVEDTYDVGVTTTQEAEVKTQSELNVEADITSVTNFNIKI